MARFLGMDSTEGVAAWVEAVGTAGAFVIAVLIYAATVFDRRRAQARLISGWVQAAEGKPHPRELHLHNGSEQPVFELFVQPQSGAGQAQALVPSLLPAGDRIIIATTEEVGGPDYLLPVPINIAFVDSAGRRWVRWGSAHRLMGSSWWRAKLGLVRRRWRPAE